MVRILKSLGFEEVRQKGSHKQFGILTGAPRQCLFTKAGTFLPISSGELQDVGLTLDEFIGYRD